MKNWKTSLAGLLTLALQIAAIWSPGIIGSPKVQQSIQVAVIGAGLIAGADGKKKKNEDIAPPAALSKSAGA